MSPDPERLFHRDDPSGRLIGINKASTFTGFCGKHDQEIFRELDVEEFDGTARKTFLAAYRTLCRELFAKESHLDSFDIIKELDRGRSATDQILIQEASIGGSIGAEAALAELRALKVRFDDSLLNANYNQFDFKNFRFNGSVDFVSAGGFNPTHDLKGRLIQDLSETAPSSENVLFSILPTAKGFWVSFLWPKEFQLMKGFVDDFARMATVGSAFGVALAYVENTFLRPSLWQSSAMPEKKLMQKLSWMGAIDDDYSSLPAALTNLSKTYPDKFVEMVSS